MGTPSAPAACQARRFTVLPASWSSRHARGPIPALRALPPGCPRRAGRRRGAAGAPGGAPGEQFIFPAPTRLAEVYGDASPLGLLWTFMGYSTPYNVFTGLVEAGAGWPLLFRRTVTAGALLAAALVLLVPDLRRLADLVLFRRPTPALGPPERRRGPRWLHLAGRAAKALLITFLVLAIVRERYALWKNLDRLQARRQASPVSFYMVDAFLRNGRLVPAWPADPGRWQWLDVSGSQASVVLMSYESMAAAYDRARQVLTLYGAGHRQLGALACSTSDAGVLGRSRQGRQRFPGGNTRQNRSKPLPPGAPPLPLDRGGTPGPVTIRAPRLIITVPSSQFRRGAAC